MFELFKKKTRLFGGQRSQQKLEDITLVRNIQEKLAAIPLGHKFGIATRDGLKVFKLIEIRKPVKHNDAT